MILISNIEEKFLNHDGKSISTQSSFLKKMHISLVCFIVLLSILILLILGIIFVISAFLMDGVSRYEDPNAPIDQSQQKKLTQKKFFKDIIYKIRRTLDDIVIGEFFKIRHGGDPDMHHNAYLDFFNVFTCSMMCIFCGIFLIFIIMQMNKIEFYRKNEILTINDVNKAITSMAKFNLYIYKLFLLLIIFIIIILLFCFYGKSQANEIKKLLSDLLKSLKVNDLINNIDGKIIIEGCDIFDKYRNYKKSNNWNNLFNEAGNQNYEHQKNTAPFNLFVKLSKLQLSLVQDFCEMYETIIARHKLVIEMYNSISFVQTIDLSYNNIYKINISFIIPVVFIFILIATILIFLNKKYIKQLNDIKNKKIYNM